MDGITNSETKYFYDTYALYELIAGNKKYEKYKKGVIVTSILNLIEFHYSMNVKYGEKTSEKFLNIIINECVLIDITKDMIIEANIFRWKNKPSSKKEKFSYPDSYGYIIAKKLGVKFLTGDEDFAKYENVEFVKK